MSRPDITDEEQTLGVVDAANRVAWPAARCGALRGRVLHHWANHPSTAEPGGAPWTSMSRTMLKHAARELVRGGGGSFVGISSIAASNTHRWFRAYGSPSRPLTT